MRRKINQLKKKLLTKKIQSIIPTKKIQRRIKRKSNQPKRVKSDIIKTKVTKTQKNSLPKKKMAKNNIITMKMTKKKNRTKKINLQRVRKAKLKAKSSTITTKTARRTKKSSLQRVRNLTKDIVMKEKKTKSKLQRTERIMIAIANLQTNKISKMKMDKIKNKKASNAPILITKIREQKTTNKGKKQIIISKMNKELLMTNKICRTTRAKQTVNKAMDRMFRIKTKKTTTVVPNSLAAHMQLTLLLVNTETATSRATKVKTCRISLAYTLTAMVFLTSKICAISMATIEPKRTLLIRTRNRSLSISAS